MDNQIPVVGVALASPELPKVESVVPEAEVAWPQKKKSNKWKIFLALVAVVLLVGGVGVFTYTNNRLAQTDVPTAPSSIPMAATSTGCQDSNGDGMCQLATITADTAVRNSTYNAGDCSGSVGLIVNYDKTECIDGKPCQDLVASTSAGWDETTSSPKQIFANSEIIPLTDEGGVWIADTIGNRFSDKIKGLGITRLGKGRIVISHANSPASTFAEYTTAGNAFQSIDAFMGIVGNAAIVSLTNGSVGFFPDNPFIMNGTNKQQIATLVEGWNDNKISTSPTFGNLLPATKSCGGDEIDWKANEKTWKHQTRSCWPGDDYVVTLKCTALSDTTCNSIKVYKKAASGAYGTTALTAAQISTLKVGDTIKMTVTANKPNLGARFTVTFDNGTPANTVLDSTGYADTAKKISIYPDFKIDKIGNYIFKAEVTKLDKNLGVEPEWVSSNTCQTTSTCIGSWTPAVDTVCKGFSVTQTDGCGKSKTVAGTKACATTTSTQTQIIDLDTNVCQVGYLTTRKSGDGFVSFGDVSSTAKTAGVVMRNLRLGDLGRNLLAADLEKVGTLFVSDVIKTSWGEDVPRTLTNAELNLIKTRFSAGMNVVLAADDGSPTSDSSLLSRQVLTKLVASSIINYRPLSVGAVPVNALTNSTLIPTLSGLAINTEGNNSTPGWVKVAGVSKCIYSVKASGTFPSGIPESCLLTLVPKAGKAGAILLDANAGVPVNAALKAGRLIKKAGTCPCVPDDASWTPAPDTICAGSNYSQMDNCGTARESTGTKDCSCKDTTWTPDPADTCSKNDIEQTSNCGTNRSIKGTKDCGVVEIVAELQAYEDDATNRAGSYKLKNLIDKVSKDQTFVYSFEMINNGDKKAETIAVKGTIGGENQSLISFVDSDSRCAFDAAMKTITCSGMNLESGETGNYTLRVKVSGSAVNGESLVSFGAITYGGSTTTQETELAMVVSTIVGCNHTCNSDSECIAGLSCDLGVNKCRKPACAESESCNCAVASNESGTDIVYVGGGSGGTTAGGQNGTRRPLPTTLPETGILDFPGVAAFGGGLLLAIIGILFAL